MPESKETPKPTIAILGGTGDLGGGLAWRWARAGYPVFIGSRTHEKGSAAAAELSAAFPDATIEGSDNASAAAAASVVVLTVPFSHQTATLESVKDQVSGKVVVDCTVPLKPPKVARVQLPESDSAAVSAQELLGDSVQVVSAFQNVGAEHLRSDHEIDCDVLVTGDSREARSQVVALAEAAGLRAWHAGPLANSTAAEAMTSLLIWINKNYGVAGAGIKITGERGKEI